MERSCPLVPASGSAHPLMMMSGMTRKNSMHAYVLCIHTEKQKDQAIICRMHEGVERAVNKAQQWERAIDEEWSAVGFGVL